MFAKSRTSQKKNFRNVTEFKKITTKSSLNRPQCYQYLTMYIFMPYKKYFLYNFWTNTGQVHLRLAGMYQMKYHHYFSLHVKYHHYFLYINMAWSMNFYQLKTWRWLSYWFWIYTNVMLVFMFWKKQFYIWEFFCYKIKPTEWNVTHGMNFLLESNQESVWCNLYFNKYFHVCNGWYSSIVIHMHIGE